MTNQEQVSGEAVKEMRPIKGENQGYVWIVRGEMKKRYLRTLEAHRKTPAANQHTGEPS